MAEYTAEQKTRIDLDELETLARAIVPGAPGPTFTAYRSATYPETLLQLLAELRAARVVVEAAKDVRDSSASMLAMSSLSDALRAYSE